MSPSGPGRLFLEIDLSDYAGFWIACALLLIMFTGEPDIADAIISVLSGEDLATVTYRGE